MAQTSYKKLTLPNYSSTNWYEAINQNFRIIDTELSLLNANITNQITTGGIITENKSFLQYIALCEFTSNVTLQNISFNLPADYTLDIIQNLYCETSWTLYNGSNEITPVIVNYTLTLTETTTPQRVLTITINIPNIALNAGSSLRCILKAFLPSESS